MNDESSLKRLGLLVAVATLFFLLGSQAFAQTVKPSPSPSPSPTPASDPQTTELTLGNDESPPSEETRPAKPVHYVFPELAPNLTTLDTKAFKFRVGFAPLLDYTFISQDAGSRSQVGRQGGLGDIRSARIMLSGQIKFKKPWTYYAAYDYHENRKSSADKIFDVTDYSLTIPLWKNARITIGKLKESFIYEMVGDAAFLPHQERILNPFFASRNRGIKYSDNFLKDRIALNVGVFNDWISEKVKFSDGGIKVSGRLTGLPLVSKDGREYLHLGVGLRYSGASSKGLLRFKGRPESNIIDNYVDTGDLTAGHAKELGLEALYTNGPYSVLSEYAHAWVSSPLMQNPGFSGFYVTGSYVITGENRPYDRKVAYARRIVPKSRWGAVEVVGRYSHVDLDDKLVKGGTLNKLYVGANWWASLQWKLGIGYGFADLNRSSTTGHTNALQLRMQWIY
jgi:phosphate-selective porin OprO and OprP